MSFQTSIVCGEVRCVTSKGSNFLGVGMGRVVPEQLADGVTLYEGDCLEVLPTLTKQTFECVVTDPPYSVSVAGSSHEKEPGRGTRRLDFFQGDDDWQAMTNVVTTAAGLCVPLLTKSGSMYWWVGHRQFGPLVAHLELSGWSTRFLVWAKACPPPPAPGSGWPSGAELCVYAYRLGRTWNYTPKTVPSSNVITADSYRHGQPGKLGHPTQKPLPTITPLVLGSTSPGDTILDCFGGSGTTAAVAMKTGRRVVLIEKDARYCEIIRRRVRELDGRGEGSLFAVAAV